VRGTINIIENRILRIAVVYPPGCLMAVGCRFLDFGVQFAPLDGWLYGDSEKIEWVEDHILEGPSFKLEIEAHSFAIDYEHNLLVRVEAMTQYGGRHRR
jgi:hypothetical protein